MHTAQDFLSSVRRNASKGPRQQQIRLRNSPYMTVQNDHVGERKALAQILSVILKPPDKKILSAGRFAASRHLKHGPTRALEFCSLKAREGGFI